MSNHAAPYTTTIAPRDDQAGGPYKTIVASLDGIVSDAARLRAIAEAEVALAEALRARCAA